MFQLCVACVLFYLTIKTNFCVKLNNYLQLVIKATN